MKKEGKNKKKMWIIMGAIALFLLVQWLFIGWRFQFGPFKALGDIRTSHLAGNADTYDFSKIEPLSDSPLQGKSVLFLGSSVTNGHAAKNHSLTEYVEMRFDCKTIKDAVDGTTLVDTGKSSYISRLKNHTATEHYDLVVVQLSTNDASKKMPLGEISANESYDTQTVTGAIEYILQYVRETWDCPVVFYTNARYESEAYADMVARLKELQAVYGFGVIDLWTDTAFNDISAEERTLYMYDKIHPLMAGYRDWWGPEAERQLLAYWNSIE